jgi:MFS family permease
VVILSTIGAVASGLLQYGFGALVRYFGRPLMLGAGGVLMGAATTLQAVVPGFGGFATLNVVSRVGGAPQHPVGNALLAEQWSASRIGSAIAVHVAGGNIGTVVIGGFSAVLIATLGWRGAVGMIGIAAVLVAIGILGVVREHPDARVDRQGPVRTLYWRVVQNRDLRWLFTAAVLGGGSRGLGVLNVFVPLYLDQVLHLDAATIGAMYAVLLFASVPGPIVSGWLSDRVGRRPVIVGVYVGGAVSLGLFVLAGSNITAVWVAVILLSLFSFVESPQLQALMADVTSREVRDAAFSTYFALAFGVGAMWGFLYGLLTDVGGGGQGLTVVFVVMAIASLAAAAATLRIGIPPRGQTLAA